MKFTAIDFETANASRDSACSIGLVTVKNGKVIDEYYKLIRPKMMYFNPDNIEINGITEDMVKDAPTFEDIWPEVFPFLHNKQVVAHFAKFDMNVLRCTLNAYYLPMPSFTYICSWILAKKAFPHLASYSLDYVAGYVGYKFNHHHALEDAHACAAVVSKVLERTPVQNFEQLADAYNFEAGRLYRNGMKPCLPEKENKEEIMGSLF